MIVLIGHDDPPLAVAGHARGPVELPGPGAQRAELMVEGTARIEGLGGGVRLRLALDGKRGAGGRRKEGTAKLHLDTIVAAIRYHHVPLLVHADPPGPAQLTVSFPFAPERGQLGAQGGVAPPRLDRHLEGAPLDVLVAHQHRKQVLSFAFGQVADGVRAVLVVRHLGGGQAPIGDRHDDGGHDVPAREARLAVVVVAGHREGGGLATEGAL